MEKKLLKDAMYIYSMPQNTVERVWKRTNGNEKKFNAILTTYYVLYKLFVNFCLIWTISCIVYALFF